MGFLDKSGYTTTATNTIRTGVSQASAIGKTVVQSSVFINKNVFQFDKLFVNSMTRISSPVPKMPQMIKANLEQESRANAYSFMITQQAATTSTQPLQLQLRQTNVDQSQVQGTTQPRVALQPTSTQENREVQIETKNVTADNTGQREPINNTDQNLIPDEEKIRFVPKDKVKEIYKPVILGIVSENINKGIATRNVVIIKKPKTSEIVIKSMKILRKDLFTRDEFVSVGEVNLNQVKIDPRYLGVIGALNEKYSPSDLTAFIDTELERNRSYLYKIKMEFLFSREKVHEEIELGVGVQAVDPNIINPLLSAFRNT